MRLSERLIMILEMESVYRRDIPTIEEAIALAKRYEDAPSGFVIAEVGLTGPANAVMVAVNDPPKVKGQPVRLVVEGGE